MGRLTKNKKIVLENLIMTVYYETNKGKNITTEKQAAVLTAVRKTLGHFKMAYKLSKAKRKVNHVKIFKEIYFNPIIEKSKNGKKIIIKKRKTQAGFAIQMGIHENTLIAYTDDYINCFETYFEDPAFHVPELD